MNDDQLAREDDDAGFEHPTVEKMALPSDEIDHCGNCWLPIGTTEWCPHCQIYNGTNGCEDEFSEENYDW